MGDLFAASLASAKTSIAKRFIRSEEGLRIVMPAAYPIAEHNENTYLAFSGTAGAIRAMSFYDAKQPMPDRQLINLAQHRFDRTARGEATNEDFNQLRDIFPALLGRFRSMVEGEPVTATVLPFGTRLSPAAESRAYLSARRS